MKRLVLVLLVAGVLGVLAFGLAAPVAAQGDEGAQGDAYAAFRGAAVYAEFCQTCHGEQGEGRGEGPAFQAITFDPATAREAVARGLDTDENDGVAMPAYAQTAGGPLSERQINDLMAYMATWGTDDVPPLPEPRISPPVTHVPDRTGDVNAGAEIYAKSCYGCHGREGRGRVPPAFPPLRVTANSLQAVREGTESPYMPAFSAEHGGPLDEADLENLDTYLASWGVATPVEGPSSEGYGTLVILMGFAAILFVGGVYLTGRDRN